MRAESFSAGVASVMLAAVVLTSSLAGSRILLAPPQTPDAPVETAAPAFASVDVAHLLDDDHDPDGVQLAAGSGSDVGGAPVPQSPARIQRGSPASAGPGHAASSATDPGPTTTEPAGSGPAALEPPPPSPAATPEAQRRVAEQPGDGERVWALSDPSEGPRAVITADQPETHDGATPDEPVPEPVSPATAPTASASPTAGDEHGAESDAGEGASPARTNLRPQPERTESRDARDEETSRTPPAAVALQHESADVGDVTTGQATEPVGQPDREKPTTALFAATAPAPWCPAPRMEPGQLDADEDASPTPQAAQTDDEATESPAAAPAKRPARAGSSASAAVAPPAAAPDDEARGGDATEPQAEASGSGEEISAATKPNDPPPDAQATTGPDSQRDGRGPAEQAGERPAEAAEPAEPEHAGH